jgi:hypothetical protein
VAKKKKDLMPGADVEVGGAFGRTYPGEQGAYGDFINQMRPAPPKKPKSIVEIPEGPYATTLTGVELLAPGQSAESTQARTATAEKAAADAAAKEAADKAAADAKNTTTTPTGGAAPGATNVGSTYSSKVSAFDKLRDRLAARGLSSLYDSVKGLIQEDLPEEEFTIRLRETPAYQTRFAANAKRVAAGLKPLTEGQYLDLEDSYQTLMKQYGLPESYYAKGDLGVQKGMESLIAGDVSAVELEDRLLLGKERVLNANPEVVSALRTYYPGITDGDVLAYTLDPKNAINRLKRQVQAAEIGGAASQAGFIDKKTGAPSLTGTRAEELAAAGVTGATAKQGYQSIAGYLPTATKLNDIYGGDGYTQAEAEQEVFGLAGMTTAAEKRKRLASQERSQFSASSGLAGTALEKGRSGAF